MINIESFELEIITPQSSDTHHVVWVEVESPTGSFFVGPQHSPLVSMIKRKSFFTYKLVAAQTAQNLMVHEGFFHVDHKGKATLVITL